MAKIYNALLRNRIEPKIEKNILEEPKWISEKLIHDITNFDNPSHSRTSTCKKLRGNNIIRRFLQGLWLRTQKEGEANTSRQRPP